MVTFGWDESKKPTQWKSENALAKTKGEKDDGPYFCTGRNDHGCGAGGDLRTADFRMGGTVRTTVHEKLEQGRFRNGHYASDPGNMYGAFLIIGPMGRDLVIMSSGVDREYMWEHVSVSTKSRSPSWVEMCFVKDLFWKEDECVVQYHPPRSEYVNHHPFCLHLWKPVDGKFPMPPSVLVGPKGETNAV